MKRKNEGFTLVEILIVVGIIGILLLVAVPNFLRAREVSRSATCIGNLQKIRTAQDVYGTALNLKRGARIDLAQIYGTLPIPKCPSGGTYTLKGMREDPECSKKEHVISR